MVRTIQRMNSKQLFFADRIEPRAAYHSLVEKRIKNLDQTDNEIIHFHGIGGIGKTTLLQELVKESYDKYADKQHNHSDNDPLILRLDFENAGCRSIIGALECLYQQMMDQKPRWQFPNYSHAKYIYAVRTGQIHSDLDRKAFLKKYPFIRAFAEVGEELPGIGPVFKVAGRLADVVETIEINVKKRKAQFSAFQDERLAETILAEMPEYLCDDICENIEKSDVILLFVDTYEKFWLQENNTFALHDAFFYEFWFKQLLREIPNAVCVIAGRDAIRWCVNDPDPFWKQHMEIHVIESLSEKDTIEFLEKSDVNGESLRHELWNLTNGDPFHLELCVKRYDMLSRSGANITLADFGATTSELVGRIVNSLGGENLKTLAYIMGALHQWNNDLLNTCALQLHCVVPTQAEIDRVMNVCNVIREKDGHLKNDANGGKPFCFTMHSRQSAILRDCLLELFRNQIVDSIIAYCDSYPDQLDVCLPAAIHTAGMDKSRMKVIKYIKQLCKQFVNDHRLDRAVLCMDKLHEMYSADNPDGEDTLETEYRRCKLDRQAGKLEKAQIDVESAMEHIERVCGKDSVEYIHLLCEKAAILRDTKGENNEIVEIMENAHQIAQKILEPTDKDMLEVESYYSVVLQDKREYLKAEAIIQLILEKLRNMENISNSARGKANLLAGNLYLQMGNLEKAHTYLEEAVQLSSKDSTQEGQAVCLAAQVSLEGAKRQSQNSLSKFYTNQVETCKKLYGEHHFMTWCYQNNAAVFLMKDGKYPEAKKQLTECYQAMSSLLGNTNYRTIRVKNNLIACESLIGNMGFSQCASEQREICHIVEEQLSNPEVLLKTQYNLGLYLCETGEPNQARIIQENILQECFKRTEGNSETVERCVSSLMRTYQKMGSIDLVRQIAQQLSLSNEKIDFLIHVPLSELLYLSLF